MKGLGSYLKKYILDKLQSENRKKIVKNLGWLFFDKIFRMGVGMLVGVWVARYLGPAQLGILSYAQAIVAIGASIAGLGLASIAVREIVRSDEDKDTILGTSLGLMLIGALLSIVAIMAIVSYLETDNNTKIIVMIIALGTIFQSFDALDFLFQAKVQARYTVVAKNTAFFVVSIVKIICLIYKMPLMVFAALGTIELALGAFNMLIAYKWAGYSLRGLKFSLAKGKKLLQDSYPLILSAIVIMIYMRIDQIMLKEMVGDKEAGIYSVAVRLVEVFYFIPMVVSQTVFPYIIQAHNESEENFYFLLQRFYNTMALVAYLIAIPITFFARDIIFLLFGNEFIEASSILIILVGSIIFTNLGVASGSFLTAINRNNLSFFRTLIGCISNVVLNLLLIPKYWGVGAAIATLISYGISTYVICLHPSFTQNTKIMLKALILPNPLIKQESRSNKWLIK